MERRAAALVVITVAWAIAAALIPPVAQPLRYHDFADDRAAFGVARFGDVASNAAILLAGIAGLVVVRHRRAAFASLAETWAYAAFFAGLALTAVGSTYYHLAPYNARLVWDRLPITLVLAGLVAGQIADRVSACVGLAVLTFAIAAGIASVVYWHLSEIAGHGNLVPYAALQGWALVVLAVAAWRWPSRYTRSRDLAWIVFWYALAKACEALDRPLFDLLHVVSGHTLKHVFAAMAGAAACVMLAKRAPRLRPPAAAYFLP